MMSEKEKSSKIRNWNVFRLRGAHQNMRLIGNASVLHEETEAILKIIDDMLRKLGAETEAERRETKHQQLLKG